MTSQQETPSGGVHAGTANGADGSFDSTRPTHEVFRIPGKARAHISLVTSIWCVALFVVVAVAAALVGTVWIRTGLFAVAACIPLIWLIYLVFLVPRRIRYTLITVTDEALRLERGRMFRRVCVVPILRITVVKTSVNPIATFFGQKNLEILATTNDLDLPYLGAEDADRLSSLIVRLSHAQAQADSGGMGGPSGRPVSAPLPSTAEMAWNAGKGAGAGQPVEGYSYRPEVGRAERITQAGQAAVAAERPAADPSGDR